jgi:hypothetical protein
MTTFGAGERSRASLEALLGDYAAAEVHFEAALEVNRRLRALTFVVRTQRAYSEMLLARGEPGDSVRAGELVAEALAEATVLGMTRECERLEVLGRACPVT